jgi:hypothetical protein
MSSSSWIRSGVGGARERACVVELCDAADLSCLEMSARVRKGRLERLLDEVRKADLAIQIDVGVDLGPFAQEHALRVGAMRKVRAAHDSESFGTAAGQRLKQRSADVVTPRIVAQSQQIRRIALDGVLKLADVFEQFDLNLVAEYFLGVGRDVADVQRKNFRRQSDGVVAQIPQENTHCPAVS